ncbi:Mediator of RNA polymerase II transcription subunit [Quillaja saponaria]|uniref:Mediator of RNA polymerase II transcription subunit n=1 Tax=Quillaja saponaria TaxID=32244 RepID=A0AAD7KP53_QUISA|nr:Mediator of RNA polymerase II transcription subunit [Quillaja saponaria]
MASTSLNSLVLPRRPLSGNVWHRKMNPSKRLTTTTTTTISNTTTRICACIKRDDSSSYGYGHDYDGKLVDENMVVLRKRILEMKELKLDEETAPSNWMEWEKQYYVNYDSDIFEAVGLLQSLLMNTRPRLAFGMLALFMLSMTMSTSIVVFYVMELAKGTTAGFHF